MSPAGATRVPKRPRLGFVGLGWIGRNRLDAITKADLADVVALCEPSNAAIEEALILVPEARSHRTLESLLAEELDGVVIATPSAQHASEAIKALNMGRAVFCQKPLGRNRAEVDAVIAAARRSDVLLGVDLSYRGTKAGQVLKRHVESGALGEVYAVDLTFHNAYGPDKDWFYDRNRSGGGCLIDLGIHLVDLALWLLDFPDLRLRDAQLLKGGCPAGSADVEDFAVASFSMPSGGMIRIATSWRLSAGQDAVIAVDLYGTKGGAALRNVGGSFYDFRADAFAGTACSSLWEGQDAWGGAMAVEWCRRLAAGDGFDEAFGRQLANVAGLLDQIYRRGLDVSHGPARTVEWARS